jgi:hypothetical protein
MEKSKKESFKQYKTNIKTKYFCEEKNYSRIKAKKIFQRFPFIPEES